MIAIGQGGSWLRGAGRWTSAFFAACLLASAAGLAPTRAQDAPTSGEKRDEVRVSQLDFESGGKTIPVELFEPKGAGKHPAVVVVHGADGLQSWLISLTYRNLATELARHGYVVVLPHYFDRTDTKTGDLKSMTTHFVTWMRTLGDAVALLEKRPDVDPDRIGLVGLSLGAYLSISNAAFDPRVKVVVEYFGGVLPPVADKATRMPPVLILHGEKDRIVPIAEGRKVESWLKEKHWTYDMHVYPGQGHGFLGPDNQDARRRTVEFLDRYLKAS
jgi:carboxymethylenebutenolidase